MMRACLLVAIIAICMVFTEQALFPVKRSEANEVVDQLDELLAAADSDVMETRDLSEDQYGLSNMADDITVEKRSRWYCVGIFQTCHLFKHCCGKRLKCTRTGWSLRGTCLYKRSK